MAARWEFDADLYEFSVQNRLIHMQLHQEMPTLLGWKCVGNLKKKKW